MSKSEKIRLAIALTLKGLVMGASVYLIILACMNGLKSGLNQLILAVGVLFIIYSALGVWQILKRRPRGND